MYGICLYIGSCLFIIHHALVIAHSRDRQAQVTLPCTPGDTILDPEQAARFPQYSAAQEHYRDIGPGDVIYIPQYWFHQVCTGLADSAVI